MTLSIRVSSSHFVISLVTVVYPIVIHDIVVKSEIVWKVEIVVLKVEIVLKVGIILYVEIIPGPRRAVVRKGWGKWIGTITTCLVITTRRWREHLRDIVKLIESRVATIWM
jgi:hypothetical protein